MAIGQYYEPYHIVLSRSIATPTEPSRFTVANHTLPQFVPVHRLADQFLLSAPLAQVRAQVERSRGKGRLQEPDLEV